jgi:transcriptional regulator with XRE-family HTH domain
MAMDQDSARRNFRDLAKYHGLTTKQIGEAAGVAVATLYNWLKESNPNNLGTSALAKVAKVLNVTIEQLFYNPPYEKAGSTDEEARARALRQIDDLLAGIDDPDEQIRAANIILATLRATRDEFEHKRSAQSSPRKPGPGPAPGPTARHPSAA